MKITVDGSEPLIGNVKIAGDSELYIKLSIASIFSKEPVTLENVPDVSVVSESNSLLESLGVTIQKNKDSVLLDTSSISNLEIPNLPLGLNYLSLLLSGPVIYRMGKIVYSKASKLNLEKFLPIWNCFGIVAEEDAETVTLKMDRLQNCSISLSDNSSILTEVALLFAVFIKGETVLDNTSLNEDIDLLISFLNDMGGDIKRVSERKIVIQGVELFKGVKAKISSDVDEVVFFSCAALGTFGDITMEKVNSYALLPFVRKLEAISAQFEFRGDMLRVWRDKNSTLSALNLETGAFPLFNSYWLSSFLTLLTQAEGESVINIAKKGIDFSFVKELNRVGAKIELLQENGLDVIKVNSPTYLKRGKFDIRDRFTLESAVICSLISEGKSELYSFEVADYFFDKLVDRLKMLGAQIEVS